jgi:alanine racemase
MTASPAGRSTACYIDHEALRWNLLQVRNKVGPQVKILSMVKANAYGHGAPAVAKTLASNGSDAFGVATHEEALELRQAGISAPIVVVAGVYLKQLASFLENRLTPVVHDIEGMQQLDDAISSRGSMLNCPLKNRYGHGPHRFAVRRHRELVAGSKEPEGLAHRRRVLTLLDGGKRRRRLHEKTIVELPGSDPNPAR